MTRDDTITVVLSRTQRDTIVAALRAWAMIRSTPRGYGASISCADLDGLVSVAVGSGTEPNPVLSDLMLESLVHSLFEAKPQQGGNPAKIDGVDLRPPNCRNRLRDEGKAYPRSSCAACGCTITNGLVCGFVRHPAKEST